MRRNRHLFWFLTQELFTSNAQSMLIGVIVVAGATMLATSSLTITLILSIVLILLNFVLAVLIPTVTRKLGVTIPRSACRHCLQSV